MIKVLSNFVSTTKNDKVVEIVLVVVELTSFLV